MKLLVDAQLPPRLALFLRERGHDVVHTAELPSGNRTTDRNVAEAADAEERIVVTKDRDFRDGHLLRGSPARLLVIATGNVTNTALLSLVAERLPDLERAFALGDYVELRHSAVVAHRPGPEER